MVKVSTFLFLVLMSYGLVTNKHVTQYSEITKERNSLTYHPLYSWTPSPREKAMAEKDNLKKCDKARTSNIQNFRGRNYLHPWKWRQLCSSETLVPTCKSTWYNKYLQDQEWHTHITAESSFLLDFPSLFNPGMWIIRPRLNNPEHIHSRIPKLVSYSDE
jgi:hypothetical protein